MKPADRFRIFASAIVLLVFLAVPLSSSNAELELLTAFLGPDLVIMANESAEYSPDIAYNSLHNEYLVVWENEWAGGFHDVYARRVSADGRILSWFAVATNTNKQINPAVAYDPIYDRYLVVFGYDYYGNGSDWDINGRFIPWNGPDAALLDFGICTWDSDQKHPAVAYGQTVQEFMVSWVNTPAGQPSYISARRVFAAGGFAPGDGFTVSSGPELRDFPDIAYNLARNEYLIVWDVELNANNLNISGARVNASGVLLPGGDPWLTGEFTIAGWPSYEEQPAVAACHTADQYLVAWQSDQDTAKTDFAIYARYLDGEAHLGTPYLIDDTTSPERNAAIACDFQGKEYLLAWQSRYVEMVYGIWARKAYPNEMLGAAFEMMAPRTLADRQYPAVGGGKGGFLTAWEHDRDGGTNIDMHGRVLGYFVYLPVVKK